MLFQRFTPTIKLLGADVPEPRVFLDFLGFEKHVRQIRDKRGVAVSPVWYDHGAYYIVDLPADKVFAHGEEVLIPDFVKAPDYEFELACIIGKPALLTDEKEALKFFKENCWLTIINDWSARDVQKMDMELLGPANSKFIIGKSLGPKILPVSDFKVDENGVLDMDMKLSVNGQERCNSNANSLYHTHPKTGQKQAWSFARIMTFLGRQNIAVHPGYIIGSGTIGDGCIAEHMAKIDPQTGAELAPAKYPWLKNGDVVRMEVQGIGVLENKVKIAAPAAKDYASVK